MESSKTQAAERFWLQRLIAAGLGIGISKRELLEDYYLDEIGEVFNQYNLLQGKTDNAKEVGAEAFFFF